jgi:hypothetical protein
VIRRVAFAHGGKDGTPYPVDRATHEEIDVPARAQPRHTDRSERISALAAGGIRAGTGPRHRGTTRRDGAVATIAPNVVARRCYTARSRPEPRYDHAACMHRRRSHDLGPGHPGRLHGYGDHDHPEREDAGSVVGVERREPPRDARGWSGYTPAATSTPC